MEDEKLVLVKEDDKELILSLLTSLVDEIEKGTECLKDSADLINQLIDKEILKFADKINESAIKIVKATQAVDDLLSG